MLQRQGADLGGLDWRCVTGGSVLEIELQGLLEVGHSLSLAVAKARHVNIEALSYIVLILAIYD
jgi:hypothetical protein